ncbi:hypothetical protein GQ44DRAFT_294623 [Phaeosphaeriaceae sp. PMI808]|nr:hypothetical protein GQ44DRAFT_294623 [Phaeosphaeriaceae sp. PMI808]
MGNAKVSNKDLEAQAALHHILGSLAEVELQMSGFREYIRMQKMDQKPLYQWSQYGSYPSLKKAVSGLEKTKSAFIVGQLPQHEVSACLTVAMESSTAVSKAAVYILAVLNKKTALYLEEMETSTLSEDAKAKANALITAEVQKVLEHSTLATKSVWVATDLLRSLEERQTPNQDWAWSMTATIMTAMTSAAISTLITSMPGHSGLSPASINSYMDGTNSQMLHLIQRTQAITNLTDEIHMLKMQDIDQRYKQLSNISESHGLRIDNLVDSLGIPNEEGNYRIASPPVDHPKTPPIGKKALSDLSDRLQKATTGADHQMQRLHDEMVQLRKHIHRVDIRLTSRLDKMDKKKLFH